MKNITVSVDEETHRLARIRAAELDTSVSALVREYLRSLVSKSSELASDVEREQRDDFERRRRMMNDVIEEIRATRSGFRAADNLSRDELYDRARAKVCEAAVIKQQDGRRG